MLPVGFNSLVLSNFLRFQCTGLIDQKKSDHSCSEISINQHFLLNFNKIYAKMGWEKLKYVDHLCIEILRTTHCFQQIY